ncbi:hypothetical protein TCAL_13012 [Tigriopus californicus]|uniref:One cut domain family member n=1 Tax=Tigriopus californicus TaxID=6832 RepID=A0A553N7Y0_TIGCA|nr:hypothetical protein TCAL_13012 [Tigriopus californicus]
MNSNHEPITSFDSGTFAYPSHDLELYESEDENPGNDNHHGSTGLASEQPSKECPICRFVSNDELRYNYGCRSCFSCRAFFRRAVPRMDQLTCQHGGKCLIDCSNRSRCRKCRFDSCLRHGMNPTHVMDEDAKRKRFWKAHQKKKSVASQNGGKKKLLEEQSSDTAPSGSRRTTSFNAALSSDSSTLSNDDSSPIKTEPKEAIKTERVDEFHSLEMTQDQLSSVPAICAVKSAPPASNLSFHFQGNFATLMAFQAAHFNRIPLPKNLMKAHLNHLDHLISMWVQSLAEFQALSLNDRKNLLEENRSMISSFVVAKYLSHASSGKDQVKWLLLGSNKYGQWLRTAHLEHIVNLDMLNFDFSSSLFEEPQSKSAINHLAQGIHQFKVTEDWLCVISFASAFFTQPNSVIVFEDQTTIFNTFFDSMELVDCLQWEVGNFWNFLEKIKQLSKLLEGLDWSESLIASPKNLYTLDEAKVINNLISSFNEKCKGINYGVESVREVVMMTLEVPPSPQFCELQGIIWKRRMAAILESFPQFCSLSQREKSTIVSKSFFTATGVLSCWNDRFKNFEDQLYFLFGKDDLKYFGENYKTKYPLGNHRILTVESVMKYRGLDVTESLEPLRLGQQHLEDFIVSYELCLLILVVALLSPARYEHSPSSEMQAMESLCVQFEGILIRKSGESEDFVKNKLAKLDHLREGLQNFWITCMNVNQMMEDLASERKDTGVLPPVPFEMEQPKENRVPLFFSGHPLSGTDFVLPHVFSCHDLAERLTRIVSPLYPSQRMEDDDNCQPSFEIDIKRLNVLFSEQVGAFCISQRKLALGTGMNAGKVSSYLRELRRWANIGSNAKKFYYYAFSWLTLSVRDRIDVFHPILPTPLDFPCLATNTIPELDKLLVVVKKELKLTGMSTDMLAEAVVGEEPEDVLNMINSPIPWGMTPVWWKIGYTRIWLWLKQPSEERLKIASSPLRSVISAKCTMDPDIPALFEEIREDLRSNSLSYSVIAKAMKCEERAVNKILARGKSWTDSDPEQKLVYCMLLKFFDSRKFANLPTAYGSSIHPSEIHHDKEDDIVDIKPTPRKIGSSLLVSRSKLFTALKPVNTALVRVPKKSRPGKPILQEFALQPIDTNVIAHAMLGEMKEGKITLKSFAECLNVNRSYFASLIRLPIPWESTTALQRSIYHAIKQWIECKPEERVEFKKNLISFRQIQLPKNVSDAKENDSGNLEIVERPRTQQQRVRFSRPQRDILVEKFAHNPKPTASEKAAIAKELQLPLRTVMVFYCNRRRRRLETQPKSMNEIQH